MNTLPPAPPADERARAVRQRKLAILDTGAEAVFDGLVRLAASTTRMPMAVISLLDEDRVWFKAAVGLPQGDGADREVSFCRHAILQDGVFEVEDARLDPRFADNPFVAGPPYVAHYAAAPLVMPDGQAVGTLCVLSPLPGRLTPEQARLLAEVAANVVQVLLLREREIALDRHRLLSETVQLTELAPVGMFSADADGGVLHGNTQWVNMLGAGSLAELRGASWSRFIHPDDLPQLRAGWEQAVRTRQPYSGLFRCIVPGEAEPRRIKFSTRPADPKLHPIAIVGAAIDMTATVRLQDELDDKNRLLESIIEHLPCGLAVFDKDLRHVVSNSPAHRLLGIPREAVGQGATFGSLALHLAAQGLYGMEDPQADVERRVKSIRARKPQRLERELPDGTVFEMRGTFTPDGALISTFNDVTAARHAERELQTSQARLAHALDASGLALWEYDLRKREVYMSQGWGRLVGVPWQGRALRAEEVLFLFPPEEHAQMLDALRRLVKGETAHLGMEHGMSTAAGQRIWVRTEGQVIRRDAEGRALQVVGTCKDITEYKKADAELRAALAAADQASQAKSDFLATMSHEIRTPLNGVIGLTQLLREAQLPPMESDSIGMIDSCAKSLLTLVDNILDLSKIEAGRIALDPIPVDLQAMVSEVSDLFSVRTAEKGIRFDVRQEGAIPPWISADPGRLRQVLLNLLGNALKFTSTGGISLHVHAQPGPAPVLCFSVTDTGIGIAPEDQARLFTRFTQVDTSSSRRHQGSGLGLAISRQLAQLMGGDVTVVSRPGQGSCFTLQIPLHAAASPRHVEATKAAAVRGDARILVAEDNEVNRLVAQRLLASLGYHSVCLAGDGEQAVAACLRERFDLILMDCQMPVMDGWQATRELRRRGIHVPVLAFTASATLTDRNSCLDAGMDDFLTKPIDKAVLAEKLARWVGGGGAPAGRAPEAAARAFDAKVLDEYFLGDMELFAEARHIFAQQTLDSLALLASADGANHAELLRRTMHRMRGSAGTLGGVLLMQLCARLEAEADTVNGAEEMNAVRAAFDDFMAASAAFLPAGAPAEAA